MNNSIIEAELQSDFEERKELLLKIRTLFIRYAFNEDDEQFYLNYSIPTVYSIWEGFVQTSFQTYIREINRLNLNLETICKQIFLFDIETKFKQLKQYPEKFPQKISYFTNLDSFFKNNTVQLIPIINTQSNVGFDVLNKILLDFNLDPIPEYLVSGSRYSIKDDLDKFLLKIRNNVSHGNNSIVISREELDRAINLTELLMQLVRDRILDGYIVKESHLYRI